MIAFGPFELLAAQQVLLESNRPVPLRGRAFQLLLVMVQHAGEIISKETLLTSLWPGITVEECTLRSHVAALRRALGCGRNGKRYIVTVTGRGYCFVAPVSRLELPPMNRPRRAQSSLPIPLTKLVGRNEEIAWISTHLANCRLVTITGPGGIGKTAVAVGVAQASRSKYPDGARLIDLSSVADEGGAAALIATQLGITLMGDSSLRAISEHLNDSRALLVLDGCEHVLAWVASLAELILRHAPGVNLLATSREPLKAEGERELRLGPLATPEVFETLSVAELMAYPAVQLFLTCAANSSGGLRSRENLPIIAEICRRLDGNALAIELAAGQISTFGVRGLANLLTGEFILRMSGRRTALQRHRTMGDTLDWSYHLLTTDQQRLLRQLSVSPASRSLDACCSIAGPVLGPGVAIADLLAQLVSKSLVISEISSTGPQFRLSNINRVYAFALLSAQGEREAAAARHAEYRESCAEAV